MKDNGVKERIITVTVNPAIDIHFGAEKITLGTDNSVRVLDRHSGGKGVNVSRALHVNRVDNLCYVIVGKENGDSFLHPLRKLKMRLKTDTVAGFVRENMNFHTEQGETVISTDGPAVDTSAVERMKNTLLPIISEGTYLVFSGRISRGSDREAILSALNSFRDSGARLVLDSKSISLQDILRLRPFLIKPNGSEAGELLGRRVQTVTEAYDAAQKLFSLGVPNVLLTMGCDGGILVCEDGTFIAKTPGVEILSTVGAGDSTIAGFLSALTEGADASACLRRATAFGTAACMEQGTNPPTPHRVKEIEQMIDIRKV